MKLEIVRSKLINLFLGLHSISLVYGFFVGPAVFVCLIGLFIAYPLVIIALVMPLGPISIGIPGAFTLMAVYGYLYPKYGASLLLMVATIIIVLKACIYALLKKDKLFGIPVLMILLFQSFIVPSIIISAYGTTGAKIDPYTIVYGFLATLIPDLTALSYFKYRGAVYGTASKEWLVILPSLWVLMLLLPLPLDHRYWKEWIEPLIHRIPASAIMVEWLMIAVAQLLFHVIYYIDIKLSSKIKS